MELTISNNEALNENIQSLQWLVKGGWLADRLVKNLHSLVAGGEATVFFKNIDQNSNTWDGEMMVKFVKKPDVVKVVNGLVSWARADEVSMTDSKTLRLWWD